MADTSAIDARIAQLENCGHVVLSRRPKTLRGVAFTVVKVRTEAHESAWTIYLHEFGFQVEPYSPDHTRWGGWCISCFTDEAAPHLPSHRDGHAIVVPNLTQEAQFVTKHTAEEG